MSIVSKYMEKSGQKFAKEMIQEYMKKKKMDTVEEFKKENSSLEEFAKNTKYENSVPIIISRWNSFSNDNFNKILVELQKEEDEKKKLHTNNISTTHVNGKEIVTVKDDESGKTATFDNSYTDSSMKSQMENIQDEHKQFQSTKENNTEGVLDYMKKNVKITPTTLKTSDIKNDDIDENLLIAIKLKEQELNRTLKVDLENKIIYDEFDNTIYSIEVENGEYLIICKSKEKENDANIEEKVHTLSLKNK